mmetsp:Transcript_35479/g.77531  ORF Transcript_35479/g.77531 Transcript_35479/m.77531 type:complete len:254 (-) Transcript_35479:657-1418(-)
MNSRGALLSGPPGIGKTSTAKILCEELGLKYTITNASDCRSAKALKNSRLIEVITGCQTISKNGIGDKHVLIFDEVDGMSSGDRGGNQQLNVFIKSASFPVICICNENKSMKMKTLDTNCVNINFYKPHKSQVVTRLMEIVKKEKKSAEKNALEKIVEQTNNDIRAAITTIEVMFKSCSSITFAQVNNGNSGKDKNTMINNFEACKQLMNVSDSNHMTFREKLDLFFIDYDLIPLMVFENLWSAFGNAMNVSD